MNAGIITRVEYRIDGETDYTPMDFTFFTASFSSQVKKSQAGISHHLQLDLKIPKISQTTSETLSTLLGRKLNIRFTDGNGRIHRAGTTDFPARLSFKPSIRGTAGSWNGYEVTITQESPQSYTVTEN